MFDPAAFTGFHTLLGLVGLGTGILATLALPGGSSGTTTRRR